MSREAHPITDRRVTGSRFLHYGLVCWMALMMFLFWCSLGCPPRDLLPVKLIHGIYGIYVSLFGCIP